MGFLDDIGLDLFSEDSPPGLQAPQLDPRAQEFQDELFPIIERGLRGEGLFPRITQKTIDDLLTSTRKSFLEGQRDLPGRLARFVPRADTKVRDFIRSSVDAGFFSQNQDIKDEFANVKDFEKQEATGLAFGSLAGEKQIAGTIANLFNASLIRRSQSPTFGSELAGGAGGAAGTFLGNQGDTNNFQNNQGNPSIFNNQSIGTGNFSGNNSGRSNFSFSQPSSAEARNFFNLPPAVNFAQNFSNTP